MRELDSLTVLTLTDSPRHVLTIPTGMNWSEGMEQWQRVTELSATPMG